MDPNLEKSSTTQRTTIQTSFKERHVRRKEYQQLFFSFGMMVLFTIVSFLAVWSESVPNGFAIPFILLLACVQVILQLFIFMHLKDKGSSYSIVSIFTGIYVAILTVAALMLLISWS